MFSGFIRRLKKPKSNHGMTDEEWDRKVAREQYKAREEERELVRKEQEERKRKEAAKQRKEFIANAKKATKTTAKRGGKALGTFAKDMVHAGKTAAKGMGEWADRVGTDVNVGRTRKSPKTNQKIPATIVVNGHHFKKIQSFGDDLYYAQDRASDYKESGNLTKIKKFNTSSSVNYVLYVCKKQKVHHTTKTHAIKGQPKQQMVPMQYGYQPYPMSYYAQETPIQRKTKTKSKHKAKKVTVKRPKYEWV